VHICRVTSSVYKSYELLCRLDVKDKVQDKVDDIVADNDEFFDNSDRALIRRIFGDASKASIASQLVIGGLAGW